jgi:hypothetical protein
MNKKTLIFSLVVTIMLSIPAGLICPEVVAQTLDHAAFNTLLNKYVKNGRVDYKGFQREAAALDQYLKTLEKTDTKRLPPKEQFAFYVNAYNAWTIKLVLSEYPGIKSIKDLGGFFTTPWKKKICRIDGSLLTLDDIEHTILRPRFKDPRIHFVVNCASKSCPPLRSEAFLASMLDHQLDDSARTFINSSKYNYLKGQTLYVSKIFKWYASDFENDVVGFFLKYAQGSLKDALKLNRNTIEVEYLDYDWSLNGQ